jgi:hypothetical protein
MSDLNVVHTEVRNGRKITIWQDQDAMSPADWGGPDDVALLVTEHSRYKFSGHKAEDVPAGWVAIPVYMYEHSGVTISVNPFGCRWDSGQIGNVWYDPTAEHGEEIARGVVKEWDQYLTGEVYGFTIEPEGDDPLGLISEHSCGGFYGSWKDCLEEACSEANTDHMPRSSYPTLVADGPWL